MAGPNIDGALVRHVAKLASLSLLGRRGGALRGRAREDRRATSRSSTRSTPPSVPPTAHVQLDRMPLRADEPRPGLTHEEALAQAPRVEGEGFAVPAFVDEK